jgi:transcriptional regulator with XRE-family HTH domain
MAAINGGTPAKHFGKQMRKERLARGWTLRDFAERSGVDLSTASLIENGKRPPNERVAKACDQVFKERKGWFLEYYEESKEWTPPGFRHWGEYEDKATSLRVWKPGSIDGLLQTQDYARALIDVEPDITDEIGQTRLANRAERQRRVLHRDNSPAVWFVVDEVALYRLVGSPAVMAAQMDRLLEVAAMPRVTMTVMPVVAHPANASQFILADDNAAYAEHILGGFTYTDEVSVSTLAVKFDRLRGECYRVSESLARIREMRETWAAGVNPLTRKATAGPA